MKFSLKPHQLLAHWMPGFVILVILYLDAKHRHAGPFNSLLSLMPEPGDQKSESVNEAIFALAFAAMAFAVGQCLDAARDLAEYMLDDIKWKNLMRMQREDRQTFDDYWFSYYVFNFNLCIGLLCAGVLNVFHVLALTCGYVIALLLLLVVLALDAWNLRHDIKEILDKPHLYKVPNDSPKNAATIEEKQEEEE